MMLVHIIAVLCVIGLVIGQILFKVSAVSLAETGSLFSFKTVATFSFAITLYGITSIAWVWVLRKIELGHVYPLMALAFIFVPIGSYLVFGERFSPQYFVGVVLIMIGIIVAMNG